MEAPDVVVVVVVAGCRFVIGRERPGQQSEVATLIQQTLEQERRQRELLEQQYAQYDADDDEVTVAQRCANTRLVLFLPVGGVRVRNEQVLLTCFFLSQRGGRVGVTSPLCLHL